MWIQTHDPLPEVPAELVSDTIFQKYITNPYLVDGKKMELRLFVAITSVEPLSVYLYNDFYLRVAASQYSDDLAGTHNDAMVHQITGGKMGDIMSQEKWPRAEFEEYLRMEEHDPEEVMRRLKFDDIVPQASPDPNPNPNPNPNPTPSPSPSTSTTSCRRSTSLARPRTP